MFAHRYPNCWSEEKLGKPWIGTLVQCLPLSKEKWTWSGVELTVRTGGFLQANALDTSKKSESLILKNQHLVIKIISLSLCVQILEIKNLILTNEKNRRFYRRSKTLWQSKNRCGLMHLRLMNVRLMNVRLMNVRLFSTAGPLFWRIGLCYAS